MEDGDANFGERAEGETAQSAALVAPSRPLRRGLSQPEKCDMAAAASAETLFDKRIRAEPVK